MTAVIRLDSQSTFNSRHIVDPIDAILVLGGGVPESIDEPPIYVIERCKVAANIFNALSDNTNRAPNIVTLSAGTAHLAQLLSPEGLPIWESTASAGYLINTLGIDKSKIFVETTSYDTISNAFFARTSFTDIMGWNNIVVITSEFHMDRTKAIFDWIFHVQNDRHPTHGTTSTTTPYKLYYVATPNIGLSEEALQSRSKHEVKGAANVVDKLSKQYKTLQSVWAFLNIHHDFYAADKLVKRGKRIAVDETSALKDSYGGSRGHQLDNGRKGGDIKNCSYDFVIGVITGTAFSLTLFFINKFWRRKMNKC